MKLASVFFLALSLLNQSVFAHAVEQQDAELDGRSLEERASTFAITGVPGNTYPRLEVRQMFNSKPNQWTLLMLAMQKFHAMAQSDPMSYYQISGIHGVPRVNWDGVGQCSSCGDADGYCTHDSVLFPAWHRAYQALFEQQFMLVVNQIVASYPSSQRPTMQAAASTMRFPFWDWAALPKPGLPTFPNIVSQKYVTVNGPTGSVTIINPLFRHDFADSSQLEYSPFTNWAVTLRYPNSNANTASSVEASVIAAFDSIRPSLQDQVFQLFSTCKDYLHFSNNDGGTGSTSCSNSLEGIHMTVHITSGGQGSATVVGGHLNYLSLASFDPVFWLLHGNVDRLFAMWQAINPNSYGASQSAPHGTWTIAQGTNQDANSPLTPFHKDTNGNFWTTNQVKSTGTFHYTYPEFADSDGSAASINSYINKLYGPSASATAGSSKRSAAPEPVEPALAERTPEPEPFAVPTTPMEERDLSRLKSANGSFFQYVANIKTSRYALNGSYTVYIFNGSPTSEDPTTWVVDTKLIGPYGVLAQPGMTNKDIMVAGSIPLTRVLQNLVKNGLLSDLTEAIAVPFLTANLKWRIAGPDGTSIDPKKVPGFEVAVYASSATVPSSPHSLPVYSEFIHLAAVTEGKAGGLTRR